MTEPRRFAVIRRDAVPVVVEDIVPIYEGEVLYAAEGVENVEITDSPEVQIGWLWDGQGFQKPDGAP